MAKFTFVLALFAAGVATWLLLGGHGNTVAGPGGRDASEGGGAEDLRSLMRDVRERLDEAVKEKQKNIDWRIARLEKLQGTLDAGIASVQEAAEGAAQANYGTLEAMREDLKRFGTAGQGLDKALARLGALEARLEALEKRPPQVIREIVKEVAGSSGPGEAPGANRPRLPVGPQRDPAEVAAEVAKAKVDLQSDDAAILFGAIDKIREHRVLDALPRLLELLASHEQEIIRGNAAAALGKMKTADAVPSLGEALLDKSELVAMEANKAIRMLTDFDTELPPSAGLRRRREARNKFKEWWRDHELEVRRALEAQVAGD